MKVVYTTSPKEVEHLLSKGYKITALGYSNSRVSMSYFLEKDL